MKKVIVLGAGMVGSTIAIDLADPLANGYQVTVADKDPSRFKFATNKKIKTSTADLSSDSEIKKVIKDFDLVIGALPGFMGFKALKSIIESGKNVVDISFFPEDPFLLDELAKEKGVTAIVDCGVSPGFSNIVLGYHYKKMNVNSYKCIVGGLPFKREWPFEYKAFFSPIDVIEEYKRPARIVVDGKIVEKDALSDSEIINYKEVGDLEAFNTDGLRSLLKTIKVPNMVEKTLRYPGHIELMKIFRAVGFFDEREIEVNKKFIRPVDLTAKLIFPFWSPKPDEKDFTILQLLVEGETNGKKTSHQYYIFDEYDSDTRTSSMARTTGYTCSAAARLFLEGKYSVKGISPPEYIGFDPNCFDYVVSYLGRKKIHIEHSEKVS